ncbi:lysophospholipid acyltransferase family protein [Streptomyces sp. CNQ085]|uniref:lysophospholipid acyltransferase family protein n=1 Tax=Streptomyces sp. CNQ085 TaxID=2886944 RepID=UPI001F505FB7|nr:lysophospholipid acyltransferase family protein [Streptomyces sp. CNQ085]MCI0384069.1 acyltransferase family protein [Streptomyces sp. CNQ085]
MADAKVIPFDDDRSRGGPGRSARGWTAGGGRRTGDEGRLGQEGRGGAQAPLGAVPEAGAPAGTPVGARPGPGDGPRTWREEPGERDRGDWDRRIAGGLAFLRRRITGEYEVDEFGYDADLTGHVLMSMLRPVYGKYFRVEVLGVENIPSEGGALVVANHSGTLPLDALMLQVAVHDHHPAERALRLLAADLVFMLPVVNELARKAGHTLACAEDAQRLLERGEVVGVMPEGFKGLGKPFSERYKLQRFGRGGFVSTALRTGAPIVPCSIVGAEEIYPMVGDFRTLARLLGIPYFPVTPTFPWLGPLGMVPLPTKWTIQFGEPVPMDDYPPEAVDDPMLMFNLTDQVRETIQHTLYRLLVRRRSVFF